MSAEPLPLGCVAGTAADELARAAGHILRCTAKHGTLLAGELAGFRTCCFQGGEGGCKASSIKGVGKV